MALFIDTSALAKRYINEPQSDAFDAFLAASEDEFLITPLVITEFESLLMRRLRQGDFDADYLRRTRELFVQDMSAALWQVRPFEPAAFEMATRLIRRGDVPVATLDALHLASAMGHGCDAIATSDRQLARAAEASGLAIHDFSG